MSQVKKYALNLSVTCITTTTMDSPANGYRSNDTAPASTTSSSEVTKIVQTAGSMAEIKRITKAMLDILPDDAE
jgi:hypothetical protein